MITVSNTSPICYLYLINCLDLFPKLFGQVTLPKSVRDELKAEGAPVGLLNFPSAIERLQKTNFRASPRLLKLLLDRYEKEEKTIKRNV